MATVTGTPNTSNQNGSSIFGKIFNWIQHPSFDTSTTPTDWAAGLVLILIACFLWSRVIKQLVEN
jgi:hypothetical protein